MDWKVRIFSVAAVFVLAGLYFDERWMTGTALALLSTAMLLRFLPGGPSTDADHEEDEDAEDEDAEDEDAEDEDAEDPAPGETDAVS